MVRNGIKLLRNIKVLLYRLYLKIRFPNVILGNNVELEQNLQFYRNGKIKIGNKTRLRRWIVLNPWGGYIEVGENCSINSFCHISGNGGVLIGNNVLLATQCVIISANHNFSNADIPICEQGESRKKIIIEDDCWLGAGVKVLAGVKIGKGSVIGAGAVVTKDIPPYSICIGVPARLIQTRRNEVKDEK